MLAIESLHKLSYIHRDIKPDNLLIDGEGVWLISHCDALYLDVPDSQVCLPQGHMRLFCANVPSDAHVHVHVPMSMSMCMHAMYIRANDYIHRF